MHEGEGNHRRVGSRVVGGGRPLCAGHFRCLLQWQVGANALVGALVVAYRGAKQPSSTFNRAVRSEERHGQANSGKSSNGAALADGLSSRGRTPARPAIRR